MTPTLSSVAPSIESPILGESDSLGTRGSEGVDDFWVLWNQCKNDLLSHYCLRWMGGNHADAEDALSEASLRAYQAWLTKPPEQINIIGWFVRLVQNHCHNVNKSRTRRSRVVQCVEDVVTMAGEQSTEDAPSGTEDVALRRELDQCIRRAIDDLPPRLQIPARLYFLQEIAYADIAAELNLSPANVRKRIQQARALLRSQLSTYLAGHEPEARHVRLPLEVRQAEERVWAGCGSRSQVQA